MKIRSILVKPLFFNFFFFCSFLLSPLFAQQDPLPYGKVSVPDLEMTTYSQDTSADAVVLREQGLSYVEATNDHNLIYVYHVRIKILNKQGLRHANINIPIYKTGSKGDILRTIKASSFNLENGSIRETTFDQKNVFTENVSKYYDVKKFTIPDVRVGTVIEYTYQIEDPYFVTNFRPWEFQSELPKIESEYWAVIPANYRYNIALRGPLQLTENESEILKDYFRLDDGRTSDCVRYKWQMRDVPSFIEEEYMTSRKNFVAAIRFELVQIEHFDGRKDKFTREWKNAENEMHQSERFGAQIRRGKEIVDSHIEKINTDEKDPLVKAKAIFEFIRSHYTWNEYVGMYSEYGIRKAFEKKQGNVGDINLSLVAAFRAAGLSADPMILSTRDNGLPTDLYPVLTEFNYVVCKFTHDGKTYLLDATDDFLPFGALPSRCLNGKGRVIPDREASYWYEIKPADRDKKISLYNFKLDDQGVLSGTMQVSSMGYRGAAKRSAIAAYPTPEEYKKDIIRKSTMLDITSVSVKNVEELSKPLIEVYTISHKLFDEMSSDFLFNPIINDGWDENPFKSNDRNYPVDFGVPLDESLVITIELPEGIDLDPLPSKVAMSLPGNGGRFVMDVTKNGNTLSISNNLVISQTIFMPEEYPSLKEFFNRVVKTLNTDLLFKKKV